MLIAGLVVHTEPIETGLSEREAQMVAFTACSLSLLSCIILDSTE